jgi:hypothetical protein
VDPSFYDRRAVSRNPQSHAEALRIKAAGGHLVTSFLADGYKIGTWTMPESPVSRAIQSGNAYRSYGGGGSRGGSMVFNFPHYVGNRSELIAAVRAAVSNEGGNVQQVLGRRR